MAFEVFAIDDSKLTSLQERSESHFFDFKSKRITPATLTKTICALANADGGEVYVGIEDPRKEWTWSGFDSVEDANGHVQALERLFPLGAGFQYDFIQHAEESGLVLKVEVDKTHQIMRASNTEIYVRRGAANHKVEDPEQLRRLEYNKGLVTFEDHPVQVSVDEVDNSKEIIEFMLSEVPDTEPLPWLKKQKLVVNDKPTVAGIVLFADEPQVVLPKAAIKIYRYKTLDDEGSRETLEFDPIAVEGPAYDQIADGVLKVKEITERIPIVGQTGLDRIEYPAVAIHEIITNAVIHRDYSLNDDVHVRIFDNRIEVESPGRLPAHITERNILTERFARNPKLVRMLNKFPNPPNKDVGEGLNTSFRAMRELKLKDPFIIQKDNSVLVILRHEKLGSAEEVIVSFLRDNAHINNSKARELCFIGDANKMKRVFQVMMKANIIERIEGLPQNKAAYRRGPNFPENR